jgi:parallel beta-helix repeat protein
VSKISGYTPIVTVHTDDVLIVDDVHDEDMSPFGTTKRMTISQLPFTDSDGTVTGVSVVSANGFSGTVATSTTTPSITIEATPSGVLKSNGTAISAAVSGTDYAPATSGSSVLKGNSAGGFSNALAGTDYVTPSGSGSSLTGITASQVGADASGAAATAQSNAETYAASQAAAAQTAAEAYAAGLQPTSGSPLPLLKGGTGLSESSASALVTALGAMSVPSGTASSGMSPLATGSGTASSWGFAGAGVTIVVPKPTGATATDTPAVTSAVSSLVSALSSGPATLLFQDGTYQVDSNSLVIQSVSNFTVKSAGRTVISQAPNRSALPNNTAGDIFIIADCTDFIVEEMTFDGLRDTVSPLTPLSASASSGQPSVTVASGQGSRYQVGQWLSVLGGNGSSDSTKSDVGLTISSISLGAGTGGGDLITFSTNLAHSYTQLGGSSVSDGFGPYSWTSDYLTAYQSNKTLTVAGRTLQGEDQQNGIHLLNCQRFSITRCTSRNTWESQIKLGTGFRSGILSISDSCSSGSVTDCECYHGYDQGISIWLCNTISAVGNTCNASGWSGISLTGSDHCTVTGNKILNSIYITPISTGGQGISIEGGHSNQVHGNIIVSPNVDGVRVWTSPVGFGLTTATFPTLGAFIPWQTAAGTSIQVSSTTNLLAGGYYSIVDGKRTEAITIATIVDSTHITLTSYVQFTHATGCYITSRIPQDNVIDGNTISSTITGHGINNQTAVHTIITNNSIKGFALGAVAGNGINLVAGGSAPGSLSLPSGAYLGGNGSIISGNTIGSGLQESILADSTDSLTITNNRLNGSPSNGLSVIRLSGVTDSLISKNNLSPSGGTSSFIRGIYGTTGTVVATKPARLTVSGNTITQISDSGICFTAGDSITITGNTVFSCGGHAGINFRGVTNSVITNNISNSSSSDGVLLEDNGSVYCLNNIVTGNTCRDDGAGINVGTGATQTQQNGIVETGHSNYNLYTNNECDSNAVAQITLIGANSYAWANNISGAVAAGNAPPQGYYSPTGLTGATAASRYVGATASGAPVSGSFVVGDFSVDHTGAFWICTTAGSPGTWTEVYPGTGLTNPMSASGDMIYGGSSGTPSRLAGNTTVTKNFLVQTGNGSVSAAPSWGTIATGDVPTLNQNTTGTAANVSGTVALANGGTGQTTQQAALNTLAGSVTSGSYLRGNGTNISMSALQTSDLSIALYTQRIFSV